MNEQKSHAQTLADAVAGFVAWNMPVSLADKVFTKSRNQHGTLYIFSDLSRAFVSNGSATVRVLKARQSRQRSQEYKTVNLGMSLDFVVEARGKPDAHNNPRRVYAHVNREAGAFVVMVWSTDAGVIGKTSFAVWHNAHRAFRRARRIARTVARMTVEERKAISGSDSIYVTT